MVAVGIVDLFELIHIQEEDHQFFLIPFGIYQAVLQNFLKEDAVWKTGEWIVGGQKADAIFRFFTLGDIQDGGIDHQIAILPLSHLGIIADPDHLPSARMIRYSISVLLPL